MESGKFYPKTVPVCLMIVAILLIGMQGPVSQISYAASLHASSAPDTGKDIFSDMRHGHWAYSEISAMKSMNIALGYPDGSFRPGNHISRIEFVAILSRITDHLEILYYPNMFKDPAVCGGYCADGCWASEEWGRLAKRYEMARYPEADFEEPGIYAFKAAFGEMTVISGDITRYEAAALLFPFLSDNVARQTIVFADTSGCPDIDGLGKTSAYGIIKGYPDGGFRPDNTLSRCEAFVMLWRFMNECDFTAVSEAYLPCRDELRTLFGNLMLERYLYEAADASSGFEASYPTDDFTDLRCLVQNVFILEMECKYDMSSGYYTMPGYVEYFDDFEEFYKLAAENRLYDPSKDYLKNAYKLFVEIIDISESKKLAHLKIVSRDGDGTSTAYSGFRYLLLHDGRWLLDFNGTDMGSGEADDPCEIIKSIPNFIDFDCDRYGIGIEI